MPFAGRWKIPHASGGQRRRPFASAGGIGQASGRKKRATVRQRVKKGEK